MTLRVTKSTNTPSEQQALDETVAAINKILIHMREEMVTNLQAVQMYILENPWGLTKEQVREHFGQDIDDLDALGVKAGEMIAMVEIDE